MEKFRLGLSAAIAILLIILILQNMVTVEVRLLWWTVAMPRAILLLLTAMAGFAVGILVRIRRR
ncbi:MAG TPA: LapA family protein [Pseudomonadales bacterium]|jgi:uncharacterized integral membrane protein